MTFDRVTMAIRTAASHAGPCSKAERLGLAERVGPAQWTLKPGLEPALRDLGVRGDIIKTMHRAMSGMSREPDVGRFGIYADEAADPIPGRLVERGLHDELKGTAYVIIDGVDGRAHHVVFSDLELADDAKPGAIVETRAYEDADGLGRLSLATRSDLTIAAQVRASVATWLDRQLLAKESPLGGAGFGAEVREARPPGRSAGGSGPRATARAADHFSPRPHRYVATA